MFLYLQLYPFSQTIGFKAGLNISNTKGLNACPDDKAGWNAGAIVQFKINKRFYVQPELLYAGKGHRFHPPFASDSGAIRLNYVNMPILFCYKADDKLSILLGPELGYLANSTVRYNKSVFDQTGRYPRVDVGIDLGFSYKINTSLGADLRFNYGFKDIQYTDYAGYTAPIKGGNRVFQAGLFYLLRKLHFPFLL
ncbi:porin family protein [Limnovirga soli]|uniref:Outer membrane beta-barrel protein n=1 Tax=Limnovirga soli TaxID=2656915 RepID=A0A8J8FH38_9BACT|nr:porin family protein [Limnovirga soli]NNV57960.1 outer membrane beta-barrel protein [Limnovirga soli]